MFTTALLLINFLNPII